MFGSNLYELCISLLVSIRHKSLRVASSCAVKSTVKSVPRTIATRLGLGFTALVFSFPLAADTSDDKKFPRASKFLIKPARFVIRLTQ